MSMVVSETIISRRAIMARSSRSLLQHSKFIHITSMGELLSMATEAMDRANQDIRACNMKRPIMGSHHGSTGSERQNIQKVNSFAARAASCLPSRG